MIWNDRKRWNISLADKQRNFISPGSWCPSNGATPVYGEHMFLTQKYDIDPNKLRCHVKKITQFIVYSSVKTEIECILWGKYLNKFTAGLLQHIYTKSSWKQPQRTSLNLFWRGFSRETNRFFTVNFVFRQCRLLFIFWVKLWRMG